MLPLVPLLMQPRATLICDCEQVASRTTQSKAMVLPHAATTPQPLSSTTAPKNGPAARRARGTLTRCVATLERV